jgi:hypothetical protein
VEEVLHTRFVPDEAEALVDEQTCDCAGRHTVTSDAIPGAIPKRNPHDARP